MMEALATGIYSGKSPWAPGTMGTVVAVPFVWFCVSRFSPIAYMVFAFALILFSIYVAEWYERAKGVHDNQEIVIDEIAGYFVAMVWLPLTWQAFLFAFVLFRLFDALKPFPIDVVDRKVQGGFGVVLDDVLAGLLTNIVLQIIFVKTTWLGVQWVG